MMNFNILRKVPTIVFDLDGTITNFEKIDNKIIREELFKYNKLVIFIDKVAWLVNRQDVMKNTTLMLKLRLILYSILAGKDYKKILKMYKKKYIAYSKVEIINHKNIIFKLKEKGYHVIIISNNKIADELFLEEAEITSVRSKFLALKKIKENCYIHYFIGNNLMDDLMPAYFLNIKSIYVGKSKLLNFVTRKVSNINCINIKKSG